MITHRYFRLKSLKIRIADSRDRLYRVALAWCGDEMLADDLVQEAVTEGVDKCAQLRDETRLEPWLFIILRNKWYRYLKRNQNHEELCEDMHAADDGLLDDYLESEMVLRVRQIVKSLPLKEREVLSLVDLEEMSYCEVADVLGIPIGTVMSRLHRARKNLLTRFEQASREKDTLKEYLHVVE